LGLDVVTEDVTQSAFYGQATYLDMSISTTAGNFPHNVLKLCRAEIKTSGVQQEVHLLSAPVTEFLENYISADQLTCQVADWGSQ
jgi:hypothetical protein